jgi:large subunit ribosomal protein L22|tara:strand:- start:306 stop:848 length:543 start_codon:yes stop_codon:yes gene_type:complete
MIEGRATARYVRTSAQKAGLVMDLIRGKNVDLALSTLRFSGKRIAKDIEKVLRSAVANAQQKDGASGDADRMFVAGCYADQGPSQKRIRPAPMGRAFRIQKRTAHLTVQVEERPQAVVRVPARPPEGGADAAATDRPEKPARSKVRKSPKSTTSESDAMKATATTEDTAAPTESAAKESD